MDDDDIGLSLGSMFAEIRKSGLTAAEAYTAIHELGHVMDSMNAGALAGVPYDEYEPMEPERLYINEGKQVRYGQIKPSESGSPWYVEVNGRRLFAGQLLNEAQAAAYAQDIIDPKYSAFQRDPRVTFTTWKSDGIDLQCDVLFNESPSDAGQLKVVLDRMGTHQLVTRAGRVIAHGNRSDVLRAAQEWAALFYGYKSSGQAANAAKVASGIRP